MASALGALKEERLGPRTPGLKDHKGDPLPSQRIALSSPSEMKVAFNLLDEQKRGVLDHQQAIRWLRCAGWCLPERQLSDMLSEQRQRSKLGALPKEERWGLRQLLEVLERNKSRENTSLKTLQQALRASCGQRSMGGKAPWGPQVEGTLAKNRSKISKERLLRVFPKADLVVSELGLESKRILDCDALADRVLQRIYEPSVPSWAGPSVFVTVKRDNAPDVRIKYASHAQLDLLFDIYCRKIQVDRSQVRFVLDGAELEDEDTFEGLHLTSQDAIKAIVLPPRQRNPVRFEPDSESS
ncbi:unnamed protein product [Effrenium voratum]|uniref:Ubiquitin-like domain-containing protein n=1 Tax=Effrenium voratum TaxID=2562239 RepID=A0AA36I8J8_9DINO|nr:unnamed protein product [Effrenium voratum]CAJ1414231.1 unnamed protein product [Effrenium voratum]